MTDPIQGVLEQALQLPTEDRARFADELLCSLRAEIDPEIESAWAEEAERRLQAVLRGDSKTIPADEVFATLRKRHNR